MPLTIPTPEEIEAMPWHQQQRVRRTVLQLLITLNTEHRCYHDSKHVSAATLAELKAWARDVRKEAKRLERANRVVYKSTPDPDWQEHQRILLEAIR